MMTREHDVCLLLCHAPASHARAIAEALVTRRLVACVNLTPGVQSVYTWEGEVTWGQEVGMVLKTTLAQRERVVEALRALHPYEVPEIVALEPDGVLEPYAAWVRESVL